MDKYFDEDLYKRLGTRKNGEWFLQLIKNHLCALESQKRCMEMVEDFVNKGNKFRYVMFLRPDALIIDSLPISDIISRQFDITIPDKCNFEGYNDTFAISMYEHAQKYGKRIDEIIEFRRTKGRIVAEKYLAYIIKKNNLKLNTIKFHFDLARP